MRVVLGVVVFVLITFNWSIAQKQVINNETYKTWDKLGNYAISNDGNYSWYEEKKGNGVAAVVLYHVKNNLLRRFTGCENGRFTADSKYFIFDSLNVTNILDLKSSNVERLSMATGMRMPKNSDGQWVYYYKGNDTAVIRNLYDGRAKQYANASIVGYNEQGTAVILEQERQVLHVSIPTLKEQKILSGGKVGSILFDNEGQQVILTEQKGRPSRFRYFRPGMDTAAVIAVSGSNGIDSSMSIAWVERFSKDGNKVFFALMQNEAKGLADEKLITNKLNVWNYKDEFLLSQQKERGVRTYSAVLNLSSGKIIQIENPDRKISSFKPEKFAIVKSVVNENELYWGHNKKKLIFELLTLADGSRLQLTQINAANLKSRVTVAGTLSPREQFVVLQDFNFRSIMTYEIATGKWVNIGQFIPFENTEESNDRTEQIQLEIACWLPDESGILIYDKYDIWKVDPKGRAKPANITKGYGAREKIKFRLMNRSELDYSTPTHDSLLLAAFDTKDKTNSFWKTSISGNVPVLCHKTKNTVMYFPGLFGPSPPPLPTPVKARDANVFLLVEEGVQKSPNLLLTSDYRSFTEISNIRPEKLYNWMTTELHRWEMPDGKIRTGILYKPENFNPTKKYPVIFHFYQTNSFNLNRFIEPELSVGVIDIPWYTSNGYLVFVPDIFYQGGGHTGQGAVNTVVSAANYLKKKSWVNATKMGLQGHSFGGFETNIIVANSKLFAAAQSGAGKSDFISAYGDVSFGGESLIPFTEVGQPRLLYTPWDRPDIYIENSTVMQANKIQTPLLLLHNVKDDAVPYNQSLSLFNVLRRQGKSVWLLEYDDEGHSIHEMSNQLDWTIRQQQFFDHYLKEAPAPVWMTQGIAAKYKSIKSGLELDDKGSCSESCAICNPKLVHRSSNAKPIDKNRD